MHLTPRDLAPMMRGHTYAETRRALHCLWRADVLREFSGGARGALRDGNVESARVEELLSDILGQAERHIENMSGISVPIGFDERAEVCAFMRTFGRSRARDVLRRQRRLWSREVIEPRRTTDDGKAEDSDSWWDKLDQPDREPSVDEALLSKVRAVVEMNIAPARALVLGSLYLPDVVSLDWLTHLSGHLARGPQETLDLWCVWWDAHELNSAHQEPERIKHLAWILRSTDTTDWQTWSASNPKTADTAVNGIQRNRARALADARGLAARGLAE